MGSILLIAFNAGLIVFVILGGVFQYNVGKKSNKGIGFILPFVFFMLSIFVIGSEAFNDIIVYSQQSSEVLNTYRYSIGENSKLWNYSLVTKYSIVIIVSNFVTITYLFVYLISKRRHLKN